MAKKIKKQSIMYNLRVTPALRKIIRELTAKKGAEVGFKISESAMIRELLTQTAAHYGIE